MTDEVPAVEDFKVRFQKWNEFDVRAAFEPLLQFADQHPFLALFLGVIGAFSLLPVLMFCTFVIMTFFGTMVGFLMVEGVLVTIAIAILMMTLFGVACVSFFFTTLLVLMWFAVMTGSTGVQGLKQFIQARAAYLEKLKMQQRKSHEP